MATAAVNCGVYFIYPLPVRLSQTFPWSRLASILIAVAIAFPSGYVWWRGMKDAGEGTILVEKEHTLLGGIYEKIRHPEAAGELPF